MTKHVLNASDAGATITAREGDRVEIRLPENPTTGFAWTVEGEVPATLQLETSDYALPGTSAPGAGGVRVMVFRVAASGGGEARIQLRHWQRWSGEASVTGRFAASVRCAGG